MQLSQISDNQYLLNSRVTLTYQPHTQSWIARGADAGRINSYQELQSRANISEQDLLLVRLKFSKLQTTADEYDMMLQKWRAYARSTKLNFN